VEAGTPATPAAGGGSGSAVGGGGAGAGAEAGGSDSGSGIPDEALEDELEFAVSSVTSVSGLRATYQRPHPPVYATPAPHHPTPPTP
jgi:hypothetical protein